MQTHVDPLMCEKFHVSVLSTIFGTALVLRVFHLATEWWGALFPYGYCGQVLSVLTIHFVNVGDGVNQKIQG